jgi:hypothetical protein
MEVLFNILSDPKILSLLSLPTMAIAALSYALYKMFQKYDDLQESRLKEWQTIVEDYNKLCNDINQTLDTLLKVMGRNNGTGK